MLSNNLLLDPKDKNSRFPWSNRRVLSIEYQIQFSYNPQNTRIHTLHLSITPKILLFLIHQHAVVPSSKRSFMHTSMHGACARSFLIGSLVGHTRARVDKRARNGLQGPQDLLRAGSLFGGHLQSAEPCGVWKFLIYPKFSPCSQYCVVVNPWQELIKC